jgi:hypothetical protein
MREGKDAVAMKVSVPMMAVVGQALVGSGREFEMVGG